MVERYVRDVEAASSNLVTSTSVSVHEGAHIFYICYEHSHHKSKKRGTAPLFAFKVGYSSSAWLLLRNNASSHIPPEDLQACLQGAGRGYHGAAWSSLSPRPKRSTSFFGSASFCVCVYDANTRSRVTILHFVQIYGIGQRTVLCPTAAAITVNSD